MPDNTYRPGVAHRTAKGPGPSWIPQAGRESPALQPDRLKTDSGVRRGQIGENVSSNVLAVRDNIKVIRGARSIARHHPVCNLPTPAAKTPADCGRSGHDTVTLPPHGDFWRARSLHRLA